MNWTCVTCQVRFPDAESHRAHFKSDWHRYNLKRKVAGLSIVSLEEFEERKASHENEAKVAEKNLANNSKFYCMVSGKSFKSRKAYENHLNSKKYKEMLLKYEAPPPKESFVNSESEEEEEDEDDMEIEEVDSDEWEDEPIEKTVCFFSGHQSSTVEKNLAYMAEQYSFFLPDPEYISDLDGLMEYLGAKVGQGHMCLWCNKTFNSAADVQRHMIAKGHCKLLYDSETMHEYADWYDYTSSYPDAENPEEEIDLNSIDDSGFELVLPSGAKVGHRSLVRYYKQSLNPNRELVLSDRKSASRYNLMSTYRALGWTGSSGQDAVVKARDLKLMRRVQNKQSLNIGMKSNNQKHFKDRNGMCM